MVRRGISAALALKLDPATPEDDLPSTLRRLNDDDLLYLAISMAKQKAVNTEEFLAYVGVNFELLKKRRGAARKQSSPRQVSLSGPGGPSSEAQLTPLFAFGF